MVSNPLVNAVELELASEDQVDCAVCSLSLKLGDRGSFLSFAEEQFTDIPPVPSLGAVGEITGDDSFLFHSLNDYHRERDRLHRICQLVAAGKACYLTSLGFSEESINFSNRAPLFSL